MYKKGIIAVLIIVLLLSTIMLSSCSDDDILETEYFRYKVIGAEDAPKVSILGLTEKGKQLRNIIIPEEIDGKRVVMYKGKATTPNLRKIIISYNIESINTLGFSSGAIFASGYPNGLKILYINCTYKKCAQIGDGYIATTVDETYKRLVNYNWYYIANMQYLFNYEDAQNEGVFFIDDLNINEQLEIIPETPKREGYTFTGWYTEPECVNRIELQGYTKIDNEIVYLYAGWQKI